MADSKQPTILIKKADGTKVRVSLDEFKRMRNEEPSQTAGRRGMGNEESGIQLDGGQAEDVDVISNTKVQIPNQVQMTNVKTNDVVDKPEEQRNSTVTLIKEPVKKISDDLMIETPHELATTSPVTDIFVDEAAANFEWKSGDSQSLLEVESAEVEKIKKSGSAHVDGHDLQEHIKMPHVEITEDLKNRAKSLVISWQKGIRNDSQLLDYAMRDVNHGGLGLDGEQADRFLQNVKKSKNNLDNLFDIVFEKKKQSVIASMVEDTKKPEQMANPQGVVSTPKVASSYGILDTDFSKPYSHVAPRSVVYDVTPPENKETKTVGPKQEMATFSLVDYRRLARDPKKCADMLSAKLTGWKSESFLLFLEVVAGWRTSPLNKMFVDTTVEAINSKQTITQVLQTKDVSQFITLAEYNSLIEVNKVLF